MAGQDHAGEAKTWAALVVAGVALVAYLVLAVLAWRDTGAAAEAWSRRLMILSSVSTLAFAGAGWLWGKEVSRQALDQAGQRVDEANQRANAAGRERNEAQAEVAALAQGVKVLHPAVPGVQAADDPAHELRDLADRVLGKYGVGTTAGGSPGSPSASA